MKQLIGPRTNGGPVHVSPKTQDTRTRTSHTDLTAVMQKDIHRVEGWRENTPPRRGTHYFSLTPTTQQTRFVYTVPHPMHDTSLPLVLQQFPLPKRHQYWNR